MSYPGRMLRDGLCDGAAVEMPARQLLGVACVCGGAACPLFGSAAAAQGLLGRLRAGPALSVRLTSDADRIPHYAQLGAGGVGGPAELRPNPPRAPSGLEAGISASRRRVTENPPSTGLLAGRDTAATVQGSRRPARLDRAGVLDRARDLAVLQRLGLVHGDTRRARYLVELLFQRVESPWGICAFGTPQWEGCPLARSGAYERVRALGWTALVSERSEAEKADARQRSVERIRRDPVLFIRPHHLMCMSCWVGSTGGEGERSNDTLDEVWRRIGADPEVEVVLVEGNCEACHCCDGFDPASTRCVHAGGLIRDYKKDLDVFQRLGLMPGARLNARAALRLIYERIPSTRDICGYGTGIATAEEWRVCGGPEGNEGYAKARRTVRF